MYNIIHNAYALRKGIPTPYTDNLAELTGENKDTFLFRKTADNSRAKSLPPLVHPQTKAVKKLSPADIGEKVVAGKTVERDGIWTISGGGRIAVPASESDVFHFAYKKVSGDAAIITRIVSQKPNEAQRAGVMIRETLKPDSKFAGIFIEPAYGAKTTWRGAEAFCKTDISWDIKTQTPRNYEEHQGLKMPYWLKLERIGNRVTVYHSQDSINWTCMENIELAMSKPVYIGLCVSSGGKDISNEAVFTNVGISND